MADVFLPDRHRWHDCQHFCLDRNSP